MVCLLVGIIPLIVIIAIIVFLIQLLAPIITGLIVLAIIVEVGLWIYEKWISVNEWNALSMESYNT
jgi:hypothetical protein